jgi:hypothetical protein
MPVSPALPLDLPAAKAQRTTSNKPARRPITSFELRFEDQVVLDALIDRYSAKTKREAIVASLHRAAIAEGIDVDTLIRKARAAA